jgi:GTP-binding protein
MTSNVLTIAIVGRPNVGKSTLFNRLAGKHLAIVDDRPGVTRDWRMAEGMLGGVPIRLIDTAGLEESFDESIEGRMRRQTESALLHADVALFLIDGRAGLTPQDEHFASWLRKQKIPVILGVNKCESDKATQVAIAEAYKLGLGNPVPLSAAHGEGLGDLYELLEPHFPAESLPVSDVLPEIDGIVAGDGSNLDALEGDEEFDFAAIVEPEEVEKRPIKLAIVGRPNVGKSTLVNALLGEERVMTGPEAGITRDAISIDWVHNDQPFRLVDTAGLRRKAKITDKIEKMAVDDTLRAIRLAQVVVLVLDASAALEKQELTIADHVISEGRALIIALNKWDAADDKKEIMAAFEHRLEHSLAQVRGIPFVTMSALHGRNLDRLMDTVMETYKRWNARVPTSKLNRWLRAMESRNPAPMIGGRPNRLRYITQIKTRPPTFAMWVSRPDDLPDPYKRYLINGMREDYGIEGVPVRFFLRTSKNPFV